jgi:hypothetical protein
MPRPGMPRGRGHAGVTVGHMLVQLDHVAPVLVGRRLGFGPMAFSLFLQFLI